MAEVILFDFPRGVHRHVFAPEPDLGAKEDDYWNDNLFSAVVRSGAWAFYADAGFQHQYEPILGPGIYRNLDTHGIPSLQVSALQPVAETPTTYGDDFPVTGHVVPFEDEDYRGRHTHVFHRGYAGHNVSGGVGGVSAFVVIDNAWKLYSGLDPLVALAGIWGPDRQIPGAMAGIRSVKAVLLPNDEIELFEPVLEDPDHMGRFTQAHVVLFRHKSYRGGHMHVFFPEPDLDAWDSDFNDQTSSIAVLSGRWQFFSNDNYHGDASIEVSPLGGEPNLIEVLDKESFRVGNDAITSLKPV